MQHGLSRIMGARAMFSQSGKKAEGCKQLSAFQLLSGCCATCVGLSQCLGTQAGWSQGAVKYTVCMANRLGIAVCCCLWN